MTPDQFTRFLEIDIQSQSLMSLTYPAIARKVGLSKEQSVTIREVATDVQDASVKTLKKIGNGREVNLDHVADLRRDALAKVVASMTEDQKKAWDKLIGKRFAPVERPRLPLVLHSLDPI